MISEKLQKVITVCQMWSSNLYLSMSFYLKSEGFDGFAHWMRLQSRNKSAHAYDLAIIRRNVAVWLKVDKIDVVPQAWSAPCKFLKICV